MTLSLDNGLTEYVLGCRILRWEWLELTLHHEISPTTIILINSNPYFYRGSLRNADPTVWGLKSPDAVDPKAKIQPTAADLRAKYIENMKRYCIRASLDRLYYNANLQVQILQNRIQTHTRLRSVH